MHKPTVLTLLPVLLAAACAAPRAGVTPGNVPRDANGEPVLDAPVSAKPSAG